MHFSLYCRKKTVHKQLDSINTVVNNLKQSQVQRFLNLKGNGYFV